jgi:hypothetical protein
MPLCGNLAQYLKREQFKLSEGGARPNLFMLLE